MPNVMVFLADDFGYGSTNAYGEPKTLINMPNIDKLAKEGIKFTMLLLLDQYLQLNVTH